MTGDYAAAEDLPPAAAAAVLADLDTELPDGYYPQCTYADDGQQCWMEALDGQGSTALQARLLCICQDVCVHVRTNTSSILLVLVPYLMRPRAALHYRCD